MASMKETILNNVDNYFLVDDVQRILPNHSAHSIRGRINELVAAGRLVRSRTGTPAKKAIYSKANI